MENTEKRLGICPNCGKELAVPADLAKFACMYCGKIMTQDMLVDPSAEPAYTSSVEELLGEALPAISSLIIENKGIMKSFTRNDYADSFDAFSASCRPMFEKLEFCYKTDGIDVIDAAVEYIISALADDAAKGKKPSAAIDSYRMIIALYFVPSVIRFKFSVSEPFCHAFRLSWIDKYPKAPFLVGTYEEIAGGFKKKFLGLCFITTAVCEFDGKPDDCYELTAFRAFRDGYLASSENGAALIDEYYETAPIIVKCIDIFEERDVVYPMLRDKYLAPCLRDIESGRYEDCKTRYIDMVRTLQRRYLPQ